MAGQQFYDVEAMATLVKGPKNVVRIGSDQPGQLQASVKGTAYTPLITGTQIPLGVATVLGGDWHAQQFAFAISKVKQLTGWTPIPIGLTPLGAASVTSDGGFDGGSMTSAGAAVLQYFSKGMVSLPKTGRWAACFDGATGIPGVVTNTCFGIGNLAGTNFIDFGSFTAQSATNWVVRNSAGAVALGGPGDVNRHNFFLIADGTNITIYVDYVQNAQVLQSNVTLDEMCAPFMIGDVGVAKLARCGFAFV